MENVSHSYAKKSYHHHGSNGGFIKATASSKSLYDDVFGGPPKFGVPTLAPRYEDYTEIFGGFHSSRASSIPVLDLPVVDDADDHFSFDVQSSHFDYSEIFGGFQVFDFGLCYEDLVGQSTSASGYDSSDEAWSPAQSETLSDESDPSAFSERSRSSSGADVHHSSDDTKQFNISYHKSFQRTGGGGSNGTTHVTRLHAIPGYTCTVSGSQASRSTEDEESPRQTETLDHNHNVDLSGTVLEDKRFKRTSHNMSNSFIMHETDSKLPEKCNEASCTPQKPFVTVSDISLRTRPSGLPPPSRPPPAKKGDFDRLNSRLKASKSSTFERKQGDSSQPYFDVEEYASSSAAAASTAAIKDAMEKAQAKLRSAKELMERKKQDLKSYTKLHLENGILEERPSKAFDKEDKAQSMCVENMEEVFNNSEVISGNIQDGKHFQFNRKSEESEQGKPNMSSQQPYKAEGKVAWREGAEFFEVVETYPSCRSPEKVKNESGLLHNIEPHEYKQFEAASESLDHLETCKNVVAKEAPECNEESEEKVNKVSYQWGNMYQSSKGEDLCSQLEHKETVTVEENLFDFITTERHVKAEKRFLDTEAEHFDIKLMAESEVEDCEEGLKDVVFEARSGQRVNEIPKQEGEKQSDVVSEREEGGIHQEENAKRSKEYFKSEKDDENSEVDFTMDPKVQDAKGAFELEQEDIHFKVAHKKEHGRDEADGRPNGACEGEDSDLEMMEVLEQQEDKTKSPVASGVEFDNISEEASVLEETEQTISCDDKLEDLCEQTDRLETELQSCERKSEVGMTNLLPEDCCTNVCKREDVTGHGKDQIKRADKIGSTSLNGHSTNSSGADMCIGKSSDRLKKTASETANHSGHVDGNYTECLTVNTKGVQSGTNQKTTGEMFTVGRSDHRNGTDPVGPRANAKVGQFGTYQEVMEERAANAKKIGDALAAVLEDVEILSSTDQRAATASAQKNQRNPNKVVTPDAQKMDERLEKDRKLQEEYLRKLEEEREREREREKDRMSVTREALERSYLETRERVERATAEIRQRAMAEARERSSAEQEARLRAERASVERATAEARQRAFEKAMAEKAIQESRERMERSSSENFSAYSRSSEMRQSSSSEQHELQSTETSKLRYSYSSAHAGIEGESPQRCKARLERYRRTSERAAKALAEKNMRDLLAQREQAERNRLAENLDAEVKRWSSGKEGNLRALLSTLQYILGPNSGWQPIPLTEVITSAAVKKAYRKATLCVHPDKLQQRGATIQQKYICEKVFDLLKEAWNRFNSEER